MEKIAIVIATPAKSRGKQSRNSSSWIAASGFALLAMTSLSMTPAVAAEQKAKPEEKPAAEAPAAKAEMIPYAPDACEFSIAFPEQPLIERKCDDAEKTRCFDQVSYTKVYDMTTTLRFRATCSAINKDMADVYTGDVMKKTLEAMTDQSLVNKFDTSFREEKGYKQAGLVGEGKVGQLSTIFIAQLWMGKSSAFSLEAEMIGGQGEQAEKVYSEVLKSVHYKGAEVKKEDDKKEEKKKEE